MNKKKQMQISFLMKSQKEAMRQIVRKAAKEQKKEK